MYDSNFFANPSGTKPKPQQSKLSFTNNAKDTAVSPNQETKSELEDEVKPKVEPDQADEVMVTNGHDSEKQEVVKQEEEQEVAPTTKGSVRKRVTFAEDEEPSSKKRTAGSKEEEDTASEEEPPSKKQRKKAPVKSPSHKVVIKTEVEEKPSPSPQKANNANLDKDTSSKQIKNGGAKAKSNGKASTKAPPPAVVQEDGDVEMDDGSESDPQSEAEESEESEDEKPEVAAKAREKVQSTFKTTTKDPYPDWKAGEPVPYAALCTTFSKIEITTKRLEISAHCSLFLRQVARLTPQDLLPTVLLMLGKLAADYAGVELGIGESLIMKAIGESTGRNLTIIKADQKEIGDLGLVAAKSRSNQPTMFKPKPLTIRGVHAGLMEIAVVEGSGAQGRKVAGIKKLLSAADIELAGKKGGVDITKDKGGPSECKFIVRTLEGKMRLGLAEKTVLVALAQAMVFHQVVGEGNKVPSTDQLAKGETILKNVYKWVFPFRPIDKVLTDSQRTSQLRGHNSRTPTEWHLEIA